MPDSKSPEQQSQLFINIERVFHFILLDRKTTGQRVIVVFLAAMIGIVLMILLLYFEEKFHLGGKFNLELVKTIHIFVLSVPVAWVLWVFRNEDKKIDHRFSEELRERHYKAIKADNIYKLIKIIVGDLSVVLNEEIKVKNKQVLEIVSAQRRRVICRKSLFENTKISEEIEIMDIPEYNSTLNLLSDYYLTLVNHLRQYEAVTDDTTLSEHYANQNYFFIYVDVCEDRVKEFFKLHGKDAKERYSRNPFYKPYYESQD